MRIAKDITGKTIWISSKEKGFCPICGDELTIKEGSVVNAYYSHLPNSTCGASTGEISEWHLIWQSKFDNTEVYTDDKKHRADVKLKNGLYLEFQNSPIDIYTMRDREKAYKKLFWMFNATNLNISISNNLIRWVHPKKQWLFALLPDFYHVHNNLIVQIRDIDFLYKKTKYKEADCTLIGKVNAFTVNEWIEYVHLVDNDINYKWYDITTGTYKTLY